MYFIKSASNNAIKEVPTSGWKTSLGIFLPLSTGTMQVVKIRSKCTTVVASEMIYLEFLRNNSRFK